MPRSVDLEQLWPAHQQALTRAEHLLAHCLQGLRHQHRQRRVDRDRLALDVELLLHPLEQLSSGLVEVIEAMAAHRQDNRLQRWQGQLQRLLDPLDSGMQGLRELLTVLDEPLVTLKADDPAFAAAEARTDQQRQQLLQLLAQRQKQVLEFQAEVTTLQKQLFQLSSVDADTARPANDLSDQSGRPNIFS